MRQAEKSSDLAYGSHSCCSMDLLRLSTAHASAGEAGAQGANLVIELLSKSLFIDSDRIW